MKRLEMIFDAMAVVGIIVLFGSAGSCDLAVETGVYYPTSYVFRSCVIALLLLMPIAVYKYLED